MGLPACMDDSAWRDDSELWVSANPCCHQLMGCLASVPASPIYIIKILAPPSGIVFISKLISRPLVPMPAVIGTREKQMLVLFRCQARHTALAPDGPLLIHQRRLW